MFLSFYHLRNFKSCRILIILFYFILLGCAAPIVNMYKGNDVGANELAYIQVEEIKPEVHMKRDYREIGPCDTLIITVDGSLTVIPLITSLHDGAGAVYVLPGKHTLSINAYWQIWQANVKLWLVAEPGERYIIKGFTKRTRVWVWIESERTGKPVGGILGSDDEPKS